MDKEEKRIAKALGAQEVPGVDEGNLLKYRKYLLEQMDKGTVLTGREDFPWEEEYLIVPEAGPNMIDSKRKTHRTKTIINSSTYLRKR